MYRLIAIILFVSTTTLSAGQDLYIIDGDTLSLDGQTYRINGIDAPEAGQKCTSARGKPWGCGDASTNALYELTLGKTIRCESLGLDAYDRHIGRCFANETDVARAMVIRGMAWAFLKFSDEYEADQSSAQAQKIGIWQGPAKPAWDFRADKWAAAAQTAPDGCPIKGNISSSGQIYHPPWSPWYNRTRINTSKGERWFCDEAEARAAGWRAPKWH